MQYDLVIRNGTVIDGSGLPSFRSDVGVLHGKIARIGRIGEKGRHEVDAEGHTVTPGFIDGHTHMDAQLFWDALGTCSCYHGVTSVVMGNCGFTLAPARAKARELVVRNLERAEDISADAMAQGIDWTWETFPEYLDAVDAIPKGINYAGYIGHSALRTWAMGERAFTDEATPDDLAVMARELKDALRAGAMGFTTSRTHNHATSDDRPVASRLATWDEVNALVATMGEVGKGIFEIANAADARSEDPVVQRAYFDRLKALAVDTGRPVTFGVLAIHPKQTDWRAMLDLLDETAAAGGRMFGQAHGRQLGVILSFRTQLPFDKLDVWKELRAQPLDEQMRALGDPALREKLVDIANNGNYGEAIGTEARKPHYDHVFAFDTASPPWHSLSQLAGAAGQDPVEFMLDRAIATGGDQLFLQPVANSNQDSVREMMSHPRTVMTFSDSGAHVSQIMDSSIQTHLLSHWVRTEQAFTLEEAVRMITMEPATAWGFHDRGLLREGMAADICVFDPATVGPAMPTVKHDLPGGAKRLEQKAVGFKATVVNGEVVLADGDHTGALPGRLLRV